MMTLTVTKKLKKPWTVGGIEARDIEVCEATVKHLVAAEQVANPTLQPNAFEVALACETLVRAGDFTGPFAPGQFNDMAGSNFRIVREAMAEASTLGEG